ncbi:MAG: fumarate reductase/succinate dehydrogenase flavoprotein subunit, partial [Candidatus Odinarchaeota archaeon]
TKQLQRVMWDRAGLFRNEQDLNAALRFINDHQKQVTSQLAVQNKATRYNTEWINALELLDMLLVAEMFVRSALLRKESRGAHYRTDYPSLDNKNWFTNIVVSKQNGKMLLQTTPVVVTKWHPPWA